jgi:3-phosphoshikimate 1-carboxyvinyltransferase
MPSDSLTLQPIRRISGDIHLPGSKSLSNRALLLAALAEGRTRVKNLLDSDDIRRMHSALAALGVAVARDGDDTIIDGQPGVFPMAPDEHHFDLGNAGTAIRPLTAVLAMRAGRYVMDGDSQMRERPIGHLVDALRQIGIDAQYKGAHGYPPVAIIGGTGVAGDITIPGNISSQFLTALLLALPLLPGNSQINIEGDQVSKPYLDLTLHIMDRFGVSATHDSYQTFNIKGGQRYQSPGDYLVEGDASSASYFLAAAAIKGGTVTVNGVGRDSVQGDVLFAGVLEAMGATIERGPDFIRVSRGQLHGVDLDLNHIPDAAMTIATTALFARGPTTIRNVYNWRVKETDRMTAMATELAKLGANVSTTDDSITIVPPRELKAAAIDTYNDHRIAMAFSLAALGDQPVTINDPGCTAKTFPTYFDTFASICK